MFVRAELLEYHFPLGGLIIVLFMKGSVQLANGVFLTLCFKVQAFIGKE